MAPTPTERVARSQAALLERGGRRIPGGGLQPDAAQALDALVRTGYAKNQSAVIARALLDAARAHSRRAKP